MDSYKEWKIFSRLQEGGVIVFISIVVMCLIGGIVSSLILGPEHNTQELQNEIWHKKTGVENDSTLSTPA